MRNDFKFLFFCFYYGIKLKIFLLGNNLEMNCFGKNILKINVKKINLEW